MKWKRCECPDGRTEERKETERKYRRTCERGGQHGVSLSILPQGKKRLKIPSSFFPPREGVRREERAQDRNVKKKSFSLSTTTITSSFSCSRLSFPFLGFFVVSLSAETRAVSCVLRVGYSTLFGSGWV